MPIAAFRFVVLLSLFGASISTPIVAGAGDGIAPAVVTESGTTTGSIDRTDGMLDADGPTRPHWCNATSALVDDIRKLGGESVVRVDMGGGRTLERYWNAREEVIIEHGADGNSCLVEMRQRQ